MGTESWIPEAGQGLQCGRHRYALCTLSLLHPPLPPPPPVPPPMPGTHHRENSKKADLLQRDLCWAPGVWEMPADGVRGWHALRRSGDSVPAWEPKPECTKGWLLRRARGRPAHKGFGPLLHGDTTPALGCTAITLTLVSALLGSTVGWGWGLRRVLQEG